MLIDPLWRRLRAPEGPAQGPPSQWSAASQVLAGLALAGLIEVVIWGWGPGPLARLGPRVPQYLINTSDTITLVVFLALGVRAWVGRGALWGCLILVPILQGISTGSGLSLAWFALSAFPAAIDAAELIRGRTAFTATLVLMLAGQLALNHEPADTVRFSGRT